MDGMGNAVRMGEASPRLDASAELGDIEGGYWEWCEPARLDLQLPNASMRTPK
jgi:hypothetical protein